jgi:hypothetical protein
MILINFQNGQYFNRTVTLYIAEEGVGAYINGINQWATLL